MCKSVNILVCWSYQCCPGALHACLLAFYSPILYNQIVFAREPTVTNYNVLGFGCFRGSAVHCWSDDQIQLGQKLK